MIDCSNEKKDVVLDSGRKHGIECEECPEVRDDAEEILEVVGDEKGKQGKVKHAPEHLHHGERLDFVARGDVHNKGENWGEQSKEYRRREIIEKGDGDKSRKKRKRGDDEKGKYTKEQHAIHEIPAP